MRLQIPCERVLSRRLESDVDTAEQAWAGRAPAVEHDLAPDGRALRDLELDVRHVRVGHDDGDSREP